MVKKKLGGLCKGSGIEQGSTRSQTRLGTSDPVLLFLEQE
jgi:hypothetical protein